MIAGMLLLANTVSADVCETESLSFEMYYDDACKHLNKGQTEREGHVGDNTAYLFEGAKCNQLKNQKLWIRMSCDSVGFHEDIYTDEGCTKKLVDDFIGDASFMLPWDQCKSVYGMGFIAHTSQKF